MGSHARLLPISLVLGLVGCSERAIDEIPFVEPFGSTAEGSTGSTGSDGDGDGDPTTTDGDPLNPNWHEDIAPLVHEKCVRCHRDGGIAPMSLSDYEHAAPWSSLMLGEVEAGRMPPWGAAITDRCQPDHWFEDDPSLTADELSMLAEWVAEGAAEGDPADAAPLPVPPSTDLPGVSATFQNAAEFGVEGPGDDYVCFSMDLGLGQTKYLDGVQMLPDNDEVVHHVLVWITDVAPFDHPGPYPCFATPGSGISLTDARLVAIWVPGAPPTEFPEGVSVEVPPGSHVVLAYHYHPPGPGVYADRSSVALRWRDQPTPWRGEFALMGILPGAPDLTTAPFMIPAGAVDHPETIGELWNGPEVSLFAVGSHMHYVGVDQLISVQFDGQSPEQAACMLHTPAWDFGWQRSYTLDLPLEQLPKLRAGDRVWMDCRFDNVVSNPGVAQSLAEQGLTEPQDVYWGEGTLDEMCVTLLGTAWQP